MGSMRSNIGRAFQFGISFALSLLGKKDKQENNLCLLALVTLAVGGPGAGIVRVYECSTNGCKQIGNNIICDADCRLGGLVSISMDDNVVAIGVTSFGCGTGYAEAYTRSSNENNDWEPMVVL